MSEELVRACEGMRWLATAWWGAFSGTLIVAISFGCLYHFGVRFRLPRMRSTMKRLQRERDIARAEREMAIAAARSDALAAAAAAADLRQRIERIGLQAQKDLAEADGRAQREREIRHRTEARLIEQNSQLDDARDQARTLEGLLLAVNANYTSPLEPAEPPQSWVSDSAFDPSAATK
jgi:hypothetical protein